jgi:hypothetical protein
LFGVIVALTLLVIVGQSLVRQAYAAASDFPALRALGTGPRQLAAIALAGQDLRALGKRVGDNVAARTADGTVTLRITGQVVLSPEIANEQIQLGSGWASRSASPRAAGRGCCSPTRPRLSRPRSSPC